jgi:spermidine synthase
MLQATRPDNTGTTTGPNPATASGLWVLVGITLCFALSGFAALLYQTAWTRQFSLVFGTSELAVATVLAAYMAGLALGAWLIERFLPRISRPIFVYGLLEFTIGAGAIAVPFLLLAADKLMVFAIGGNAAPPDSLVGLQSAFYVVTAFVVLAVPTACMGATLPLLTRHLVTTPAQIGRRVGFLYAINTLGAAGGALCAAYLLMPALGLTGTVLVGAFVNVIVFALAATISRASSPRKRPPPSWDDAPSAASPQSKPAARHPLSTRLAPGRQWILPVMLISGAASFIYEVLWTRMLSHILGGSIFAFATMVASFLLGIAAGSAVASRVARSLPTSLTAFVVCQIAAALASIGIYLGIDALVPQHAGLAGNAGIAMAVLLPATFFIGATFPLAVRILVDEPDRAAPASARVYAWNTVGAIAGALLAGFVLIPLLKFEGTIYLAVLVNLGLALLTCLLVARAPLKYCAAALAVVVTVAILFRPQPPVKLLRSSPLNVATDGALRYYGVGRSASVVALEQNGMLVLRTNGLPEAMMEMTGSVPRFSGEFWLSPLAVLARPETKSMLVVGYGGGIVIDGIPPSVDSVDVIELEPEVIEANRALRSLRKRDPLADPRVHIVLNDARGALALTTKRYDAVVSQPSHPWTAGASHLYTREFMQQVAAHLNPKGVFIQWMNISFLDEALLRSLSATLLDVFEELRIYRPDPNTLVFVASNAALHTEEDITRTRATIAAAPSSFARYGIEVPEDLLVALSADQQGAEALARGADLITDDRNRLATDTVYDRGGGFVPTTLSRVLEAYDPLQRRASWIYRAGSDLAFGYMARRLAQFIATDASHADRILRMSRLVPDASTAAYMEAVARGSRSDATGARRLLQESLGIDPSNQNARFDLIRSSLPRLSHDTASAEVVAEAEKLPSVPAALVQAGRHAAREEWQALPALDPVLAQSRWTDSWHAESVLMRADWRLHVTNPEYRARFGRDALLLLEELILTQPSTIALSLRARAAIAVNRPDILLESINAYAESVNVMVNYYARADLPGIRGYLESLNSDLGTMRANPHVEAARVDEVRAKLLKVRDAILSRATANEP